MNATRTMSGDAVEPTVKHRIEDGDAGIHSISSDTSRLFRFLDTEQRPLSN